MQTVEIFDIRLRCLEGFSSFQASDRSVSYTAKSTDLNIYTETHSKGQVFYIDTIQVFFKSYPFEGLRRLTSLRNRLIARRYGNGLWLRIQQPSLDDFKFLGTTTAVITRVDLALDIESGNSVAKAKYLSKIIKMKYTRKGYGSHKKKTIRGVCTYYRAGKVKRNLIIYGDRPSKVTGSECVHIELRLRGTETITRNGINFESMITGKVDIEKLFGMALRIELNNKNCHNFDRLSTLLEVLEKFIEFKKVRRT